MDTQLESKLAQLDHYSRVVFALLCAERQIQCLHNLVDKEGPVFDDIKKAIDCAFDVVIGDLELRVNLFQNYIARFLLCTPDTDKGPNASVIQKIHALNSVIYALEILLADDLENTVYVSRLAKESVSIKIHSMEDDSDTRDIEEHGNYKKEILKQKVDIEMLKQQANYDRDFISQLRENNTACQIEPV